MGFCVRSKVTVGNGAEADMVAMLEEHGNRVLVRKFGFIIPSALDIDPDSNILAADEVVDAIAMAAGGKGWLWVPSYVVIRIVLSSAHLCTYSKSNFRLIFVIRIKISYHYYYYQESNLLQLSIKYLLSNWATSSHGASVISSRTWISLCHLLPIFPPLTTISYLRKE